MPRSTTRLLASTSAPGTLSQQALKNAGLHTDLESSIDRAEPIHAWISRQLPDIPHPEFRRPFNYFKLAVTVTATLGLITFGTVAAPYILPVIQNRNLWAAVSLIAVLLFTSGHMFNHIRKVPYVASDGRGSVSYFAGGFQNQFGLETQIVAALCKPPTSTPLPPPSASANTTSQTASSPSQLSV